MFTGIIKKNGKVVSNSKYLLRIRAPLGKVPLGASVAINGTCLTVTRQRAGVYDFDVSPETLKLTNLGRLEPGHRVNIETSLKASDLIGGHWVSGHVDACAPILEREVLDEDFTRMRIRLPKALRPMVAYKGSIAVDGVSLTVTGVGKDWFETVLIPETLDRTTLGPGKPGTVVNLEADVMARYIHNILEARKGGGRAKRMSAKDLRELSWQGSWKKEPAADTKQRGSGKKSRRKGAR